MGRTTSSNRTMMMVVLLSFSNHHNLPKASIWNHEIQIPKSNSLFVHFYFDCFRSICLILFRFWLVYWRLGVQSKVVDAHSTRVLTELLLACRRDSIVNRVTTPSDNLERAPWSKSFGRRKDVWDLANLMKIWIRSDVDHDGPH